MNAPKAPSSRDDEVIIQYIIRALITLIGAGLGLAAMLGGVQLYKLSNPEASFTLFYLVCACAGAALVVGAVFFAFSWRIYQWFSRLGHALIERVDRLPFNQFFFSVIGLIIGLIVAALISNILKFMGDSMFTTVFSMLLFLLLGILGYTIGYRRSADFAKLFSRISTFRLKGARRRQPSRSTQSQEKLLDASVLVDGRVADVQRTGFLEGVLVIPAFVADDLRRLADSSDPVRHAKGRRGLDMAQQMIENHQAVQGDEDVPGTDDVDVKLLRLAKKLGAVVVTVDQNLCKAAAVSGVQTLNLHALANMLRPRMQAGDELDVTITKEGREPGQGIAYLPDGTMTVVENASGLVGETVRVTVSSVLQTSAGRMVFALIRRKD